MEGKKVPIRMCIVCRENKPKKELIRIVKTENNEFAIDKTGKLNGRGSYICNCKECFEKLIKQRVLNKVFRCNVDISQYENLKEQFFGTKED
jgi:predicted RNA-binding protein YlxR (DUF448 family)